MAPGVTALCLGTPPGQGIECRGSQTAGSKQPCPGHRPGFRSAEKYRVRFLVVGGQAWWLPSEQEDSRQPPGPHPIPYPWNCGSPSLRRARVCRCGAGTLWCRVGGWGVEVGSRVREKKLCQASWPKVTENPPQNGFRKARGWRGHLLIPFTEMPALA